MKRLISEVEDVWMPPAKRFKSNTDMEQPRASQIPMDNETDENHWNSPPLSPLASSSFSSPPFVPHSPPRTNMAPPQHSRLVAEGDQHLNQLLFTGDFQTALDLDQKNQKRNDPPRLNLESHNVAQDATNDPSTDLKSPSRPEAPLPLYLAPLSQYSRHSIYQTFSSQNQSSQPSSSSSSSSSSRSMNL